MNVFSMFLRNIMVIELMMFIFQHFISFLFVRIVRWFAIERRQRQCIFRQAYQAFLQKLNDISGTIKRALHLFPCDEFSDLFGHLPEFVEINMAIRKSTFIGERIMLVNKSAHSNGI